MPNNKMNNFHYIAKSLTKPWEGQERRLEYFDFDKNEFSNSSSKSLFSSNKENKPDLEKFFSDKIEAPLGKIKANIKNSGKIPKLSDNWNEFRAIYLHIMLQASRVYKGKGQSDGEGLDAIAKFADAELNSFIKPTMDETQVFGFFLKDRDFLCIPETGFFAFWVQDDECVSRWSIGYGMPLFPDVGMVIVSNTANTEYLQHIWQSPHVFTGASVGFSNHCQKVVIPDKLKELNGESEVREALIKWRELTESQNVNVMKIREIVSDMYRTTGFELEEDGSFQKRLRVKV